MVLSVVTGDDAGESFTVGVGGSPRLCVHDPNVTGDPLLLAGCPMFGVNCGNGTPARTPGGSGGGGTGGNRPDNNETGGGMTLGTCDVPVFRGAVYLSLAGEVEVADSSKLLPEGEGAQATKDQLHLDPTAMAELLPARTAA